MAQAYQVIARRWRPRQFDELVGQDHIVRTLKNAIETNRIAHAYLFVGPRGTGKTTTARIFAKALNCENGPSANPPDDSPICQAIMAGNCMDVIEFDAATNTGVDYIRELREACQYAPAQCRFKIYIIDEVHMLSVGAWNALLKTLEEPPPHVKFIFATTEAQKVLPTVLSRCQRFEFRPIPDALVVQKLSQIAQAEKITISEPALKAVARLANGGMRDAQSILDQLISFCGTNVDEKDVLDVYGLVSSDRLKDIATAMAAGDYGSLIALIDSTAAEGRDLFRALQDLEERVREALLDSIRQKGRSAALGTPLTTESLLRMLEALHDGENSVRSGLSQKVNFEVALLKAVEQSRSRAIDTVLKDLSELAAGLPQEAGQKKKLNLAAAETKPTPPPPAPAVPGVSTALPQSKPPSVPFVAETPAAYGTPTTPPPPPAPAPGYISLKPEAPAAPPAPKAPAPPPAPTTPEDDGPPPELIDAYADAEAAAGDRATTDPATAAAPTSPASATPAPSFEDALKRVPDTTRALLEELFRARFTSVRTIDPGRIH